jgi:hypothetical protein
MMGTRWSREEWEAANTLLVSRSNARCEACGGKLETLEPPRTVRHHRQRKAVGGDRLANLMLIHGECHLEIHANPERSRDLGHIVSVYVPDPATAPVLYQRGPTVLLDDLGTKQVLVAL